MTWGACPLEVEVLIGATIGGVHNVIHLIGRPGTDTGYRPLAHGVTLEDAPPLALWESGCTVTRGVSALGGPAGLSGREFSVMPGRW